MGSTFETGEDMALIHAASEQDWSVAEARFLRSLTWDQTEGFRTSLWITIREKEAKQGGLVPVGGRNLRHGESQNVLFSRD